MSLVAVCWWTLARAVVLCLIAWPICRLIDRSFQGLSSSWRPWLLAGLLAPYCFPELLVGYAFRDLAMARPDWAEALCSLLLLVRLIPVGTIALLATPHSGPDASAIHCRAMLARSTARGHRDWSELARCYWHGRVVRALPALALMGIVAFQEFELAALLQTMSWTDWFVTAQWQGLDRTEMMRLSLWPLLWQAPLLFGLLHWLHRSTDQQPMSADTGETRNDDGQGHSAAGQQVLWGGVVCIGVALMVGCLIPLALMGWRTIDGLALLSRQRLHQFGLASEIATSGAVALCATAIAWTISGRLHGLWTNVLWLGLFGSLLLSLGAVALFQLPGLHWFYDTPVPWVLVLSVWLLPRAAILRVWLKAIRNHEGIHLAEMLDSGTDGGHASSMTDIGSSSGADNSQRGPVRHRARRSSLLWHLRDQPHFLAGCLLWYWAYCDLPSAYMLAPTGMASGLVRLYNFMHFGRSAALSAQAFVFFGVPVVCLFLVLMVNRKFR